MKQFTSHIDFSLAKKRFKMMVREHSLLRAGSKSLLLLPLLGLLILSFCSKKKEYPDQHSEELYYVPELHFDGKRSQELGIPITIGAHFTSSGELFTGTQNIYYTENDSLYMEMYFEDGINTGSVMERDGDIYRIVNGVYLNGPHTKEIYVNENLTYENIPPTESKDGMGHIRTWHRNGQLGAEVTYTEDQVYQGLMTEYDEEGIIITQERYEDGELVEKIK